VNYSQLLIDALTVAVIAEAIVESLKLPVAIVKRIAKVVFDTTINRVKPFDCGFCMVFWIALVVFRFDPTAIAAAIMFRQIINRLRLF